VESLVQCVNVWKIYHSGKIEVPALQGVNLDVQEGEFVAVMGPSGCGKSTLLYVLGGLTSPTSGVVLVDGNDLSQMSDAERTLLRRRKIGFVFQRFNLLPTLTARGNIAIAQHIQGDGFDPHRFEVTINLLGLKDRLHHRPAELSGGEQQRVAIARALVAGPKILLADEPTGNLDSRTSLGVMALFREMVASGITVILVTHETDIAAFAARLLTIRDGLIQSDEWRKPHTLAGGEDGIP